MDLCGRCSDTSDLSGIEVIVRPDLITEEAIEIQDDYIGDEEGDKYYDDYTG